MRGIVRHRARFFRTPATFRHNALPQPLCRKAAYLDHALHFTLFRHGHTTSGGRLSVISTVKRLPCFAKRSWFLGSYETLPLIDPDRYIRNASFIYDNAVALLTFLARGNDDDLRRAKIIADTFITAANNDRHYTDGRLRNAYMSGDPTDHVTGKARIPGWWDPVDKSWHEDKYQIESHRCCLQS